MTVILADVLSLAQHIATLSHEPQRYQSNQCAHCGRAKPWFHGSYPRKADRETGTMNPIRIPRFFCHHCHKTFSVLPECIPPHRWYLWVIQQAVLLKVLLGASIRAVSQCFTPSRSTCRRWMQWLKEQFSTHRSVLVVRVPRWALCSETPQTFWPVVLAEISFDRAMLWSHQAGLLNIP